MGNLDQFCQLRLCHEADLFEVAGVNPHKGGSLRADCSREIMRMCSVCRADFHQCCPALTQNIGYPKTAPDLDQLPAADDHLPSNA